MKWYEIARWEKSLCRVPNLKLRQTYQQPYLNEFQSGIMDARIIRTVRHGIGLSATDLQAEVVARHPMAL